MKKKSVLILFLISLFLISFVSAQNPLGEEVDKIKEGKDKIDDTIDKTQNLKSNITQTDFLKQEWEKILKQNRYFAPIISFFEKISPVLNPIFKYTVGIKASLSFLFILALIIWFVFLIYSFKLTGIIVTFSPLGSKSRLAFALAAMVAISLLGISAKLSGYIISAIGLLKIWWVKLIAIIIVIFGLMAISAISKSLDKFKKEMDEEIAKEKIKSGSKVIDTYAEALTKK